MISFGNSEIKVLVLLYIVAILNQSQFDCSIWRRLTDNNRTRFCISLFPNSEEAVIKVVSIMQIATTNEVPIINITKRLPNPFKSSCKGNHLSTTNTSKKSTCTTETVCVSPGVASFQNVSTNTNFLRSPTSWEIRGVKVHTEEEIARAKGMERKRRLFWNAKTKKLCKDTKKPKGQITKKIYVA